MESIKKTVRVIIEKEIEIELMPSMFKGMSIEEYLDEFRNSLWDVDDIDDVIKYAARIAATNGGGHTHDGIGLLSRRTATRNHQPDVKFVDLMEFCSEEII